MQQVRIDILRHAAGADGAYWQSFLYTPENNTDTAATALTKLNGRSALRDAEGNAAALIRWECGCLQKKCGACAMVINGRPGLACDARLTELSRPVRLEPLRKFPIVEDLIVDRSEMFRTLTELRLWLADGTAAEPRDAEISYEASRCMQCGCCLEICPNFAPGGTFAGMSAAIPAARLLSAEPSAKERETASALANREALARAYRQRIFEGCGKSLACRSVCPAGIDIDRVLSASNAAAVWTHLVRKRNKSKETTI